MRDMRFLRSVLTCAAAFSLSACTQVVYTNLSVWPGNINLGMTDDGMTFSAPLGASGAVGLTWAGEKTTRPRFMITGNDSGATITAKYPGADTLIVTASNMQQVQIPVTVISYPSGSVARGQEAVTRIGCQKSGCHDATGPDYSPSRIVGFDDRDIQQWIINGHSLKTGAMVPNHAWPVTLEEEQGVVAYLRSLPPRGPAVMQ